MIYISIKNYCIKGLLGVLVLSINNFSQENQLPAIAKWYNNYDCAISLRFDDNLDSHVNYVVPLLNKYNIKATFMINPGRNNLLVSYDKNKNFWEKELPQMGHSLGNHTWSHQGAENLKEADYEISSGSKLIWKLYPNESKLNVFASGGGEKWGGKRWYTADGRYKEILKKYFLIDLYDGKHPAIDVNSDYSQENLEKIINSAIIEKKYQAFSFHKIGGKNIIDYLRQIITGYNYTFGEDQFLKFIEYLNFKEERIWVAPLIQILKYETEYKSAELEILSITKNSIIIDLKIDTDPYLYDQEITLLLPLNGGKQPENLFQDNSELPILNNFNNQYFVNLKPTNSRITIKYL